MLQLDSAPLHLADGGRRIQKRGRRSLQASLGISFRIFVHGSSLFHVCEFGVVGEPYEFYGSDRAVSLFGDDDFGDAFFVGIVVVIVVTLY